MEQVQAVETLQRMGNALYGIDQVQELNGMGFNKFDYQMWPQVSGQGAQMARLLRKYHRQLATAFGEDQFQAAMSAYPTEEHGTYIKLYFNPVSNLIFSELVTTSRMGREVFQSYVDLHKSLGFFFHRETKCWAIGPHGFTTMDISAYEERLAQLDIGFSNHVSLPEVQKVAAALPAPKQEAAQKRALSITAIYTGEPSTPFKFVIAFPFHQGLVDLFSNKSSQLSGITEYDPSNRTRITFSLPLVEEALVKAKAILENSGWPIEENGMKRAREYFAELSSAARAPIPEVQALLPEGKALFPFQNEVVRFIDSSDGTFYMVDGGNALCGLEVGTGKTICSLSYVAKHNLKAIVIGPKVVRRNWVNEAQAWFPSLFKGKALELSLDKIRKDLALYESAARRASILSVNYEAAEKVWDRLMLGGLNLQDYVLICDESQMLKDPKSARSQFIMRIAPCFKRHILLSGTAVKNRRVELFPQLKVVNPNLYESADEIRATTIGGTWHNMRRNYISMTKREVLKDLPPLISSIVEVEVNGLPDWERGMQIGDFSALKAEIAVGKAATTVEFIREITDTSDANVLCFSDSVEATMAIYSALSKDKDVNPILHHGQMKDDWREQAKEDFQSGRTNSRVFCTTRQSLAVGATLTRASIVVFNDLPWTPADIQQAEARAHRIGSKETVNVYWVTVANNKFDARVSEILRAKYDLTKKVNEGKQLSKEEKAWLEKPISRDDIFSAESKIIDIGDDILTTPTSPRKSRQADAS